MGRRNAKSTENLDMHGSSNKISRLISESSASNRPWEDNPPPSLVSKKRSENSKNNLNRGLLDLAEACEFLSDYRHVSCWQYSTYMKVLAYFRAEIATTVASIEAI